MVLHVGGAKEYRITKYSERKWSGITSQKLTDIYGNPELLKLSFRTLNNLFNKQIQFYFYIIHWKKYLLFLDCLIIIIIIIIIIIKRNLHLFYPFFPKKKKSRSEKIM
jgi:hypothetical protein